MKISGFDRDEGNWPKCGKHGLSRDEIEQALISARFIVDDPHPSEPRFRAVGLTGEGRHVFVAFTTRLRDGNSLARPISARYMQEKEIRSYEANNPEDSQTVAGPAQ